MNIDEYFTKVKIRFKTDVFLFLQNNAEQTSYSDGQ